MNGKLQDAATLVVVCHDLWLISLLRRYAGEAGYDVALVERGEAVARARRERPAAVFLEVGNRAADGRALLQELKSDRGTSDIPVVLCAWPGELDGAGEGADATLWKPVGYEAFLAAIRPGTRGGERL